MAGTLTRLRNLTRLSRPLKTSSRPASGPSGAPTRTQEELSKYVEEQTKNRWTSYGVIPYDQKWDRIEFHQFTAAASFMLVSIGFWTYYKRDCMKKSWARREAHLLMQEREAAGLPYVDRNFINPAKLELPTDEELEGYPIII